MAKAPKVQKTNAMRELERKGVPYILHTYEDDGVEARGLGEAIAEQLGEDPGQGFKTLVTVSPAGNHVVCCVPVAEELDFKAAARAVGEKSLEMLPTKQLTAVTGYVRGGCSPIGMKRAFPPVFDETCVLFDTVFISGGRRGIQLEVPVEHLLSCVDAVVADICRA